MLKKLLKYEIKSQYKVQCAMYLIAFILSLAVFASNYGAEHSDWLVWEMMAPFATAFSYVSLAVIFIATIIFAILRYRGNLLKDEGYLMNTLPAPAWQLFASKMLAGIGWLIVDVLAAYLVIALNMQDAAWLTNRFFPFLEQSGLKISAGFIIMIVLYVPIAAYSSLSQYYVSLNLGYTMRRDKDLMSFVMYIATYLVGQLISMVGLSIVIFHDFGTLSEMVQNNVVPNAYFMHIFIMSGVIGILLGIAYNCISVYLLKRKLNLE